jgi:N-acetylneuraminic acid mutarotase
MHRWFRWSRATILTRATVAGAFALVLLAGSSSAAQETASGPTVTSAVRHDTSPPLRTLKPSRASLAQEQRTKTELSDHAVPRETKSSESTRDRAAVQTGDRVVTDALPDFDQNFEGVGNVNGVLPPDTQGDVGPNHYVQMINLSFAVYSKTGDLLLGPLPNTALWQGFGGPCETFNGGDPITIYDEEADRWFMSQLAYPGGAQGFHACIAVSATPDPTGAYHRYDFLYSPTLLNDYPKFGIWNDSYFMTANDFQNAAFFTGVGVQAYEREAMLNGDPADVVTFHIGNSSGIYASLLPADAEGQELGFSPPPGSPAPFVMFDDDSFGFSPTDRILMWDFAVDWANPGGATFGVGADHAPNRFLETAPFDSNLCNYARSCIPQPGTTVGLDAFGDRLLHRAAYRSFGSTRGMVLNHGVDVDGTDHAGVRWYQLEHSAAGWSINQQGTFAPDAHNRWMGSGALDASGNLLLGYSVSSSTKFPSISVAGRLAGDPAGQLSQGESEMQAGGGSQTHGASRWGDYSAMQVDPTDGCTFWFTTEYLTQTSVADWHTRIGSLKFPNCTAGPAGDLTGTVTNSSNNQPIAGALVSTSNGTTTTDSQGHYTLTLPAGTYDVTFSAFGFNTETVSGVVITDGGTTTLDAALDPAPSVTLSGTVTDGSGHGWPLYTRIEIAGTPLDPIYTDPVTGEYSLEIPANATYSVTYTATLPGYQVVTEDVVVGGGDTEHNVAIPIQDNCTAPGYELTAQLIEDFNEGQPAGWEITDAIGAGQTWTFDDLGNRGNLTGGDGRFAIIDSDRFGPGQTQDTSLVTPTVDLSGVDAPVVGFNEDYLRWPLDTNVDVDVSIDGGTTWQNVFHEILVSRRGPRETTVPIPQAANQSNVKVRWRYRSTFGFWWEVDNPYVGVRTCAVVPGGLVVGNVFDANTNEGLNGATVTSDDEPADKGTSVATPDDPNNPDGYYQLFSSLTGPHPFTASKSLYQSQTQTVNVAADDATRADFTLGAGILEVSPTSLTSTQVLGTTTTRTLSVSNTGTAPATFELGERQGSFQILTKKGSPLIRLRLNKGAADPGWLGDHANDEQVPGIDAGPPRQPTWSPIAQYPEPIMDNSADVIDDIVYSVGGFNGGAIIANGYAYDPAADTWSSIANMPAPREKPGAGAIGGKLYVAGGWDTNGVPIPATVAFDPGANTWATVAANPAPRAAAGTAVVDDRLYQVGGCADAFCTPSNNVVRFDPAGNSWETLAPYPHATSWLSCGGIDGKLYCAGGLASGTFHNDGFVYDPGADSWSPIANMPFNLWGSAYSAANGMLLISSGLTQNSLTNQGLAYDPSANSWSALPNAQFPRFRGGGACGFYKLGGSSVAGFSPTRESERLSEFDQCGVTDVPWLAEDPTTATVNPGQTVNVVVTFTATPAAGVTQPGTYTAQIVVNADTPTKVDPIPVTMNVTPPKDWGKVTGVVTGLDCNGNSKPLRATVFVDGTDFSMVLRTGADGVYAYWGPEKSNPYTLIASATGWIPQTQTVRLKKGKTTTVNFTLRPVSC